MRMMRLLAVPSNGMVEVDKSKADVCCVKLSNGIPRFKPCKAPSARPLCANSVIVTISKRPNETIVRRRQYQDAGNEIWKRECDFSKPTTDPSWNCNTAVTCCPGALNGVGALNCDEFRFCATCDCK